MLQAKTVCGSNITLKILNYVQSHDLGEGNFRNIGTTQNGILPLGEERPVTILTGKPDEKTGKEHAHFPKLLPRKRPLPREVHLFRGEGPCWHPPTVRALSELCGDLRFSGASFSDKQALRSPHSSPLPEGCQMTPGELTANTVCGTGHSFPFPAPAASAQVASEPSHPSTSCC